MSSIPESASACAGGEGSKAAAAPHFEVPAELAEAIIARRTAALAMRDRSQRLASDGLRVCKFTLADERYALPATAIDAIIGVRPFGAAPIENLIILGTLFDRGEIWIVCSLRALLGGEPETDCTAGRLLLLRRPGRRAAVLVDRVEEICLAPAAIAFGSNDEGSAARPAIVRGVAPDGLMLLDQAAIQSALARMQRSYS